MNTKLKFILFFLCFFSFSNAQSQYYLGRTRKSNHTIIKSSLGTGVEITKVEKNYDNFLYSNTVHGQMYDENDICIIEVICPLSSKEKVDFLEFINEEGIKISKDEWRRTIGAQTISIKYVENGDASYFKLTEEL
jgi:hypothetical protein